MSQSAAMAARTLDTQGAAEYVHLSKSYLDKLRLIGGGPAYLKIGKRVLYEVADLDAWKASNRRTSTSDTTPASARS